MTQNLDKVIERHPHLVIYSTIDQYGPKQYYHDARPGHHSHFPYGGASNFPLGAELPAGTKELRYVVNFRPLGDKSFTPQQEKAIVSELTDVMEQYGVHMSHPKIGVQHHLDTHMSLIVDVPVSERVELEEAIKHVRRHLKEHLQSLVYENQPTLAQLEQKMGQNYIAQGVHKAFDTIAYNQIEGQISVEEAVHERKLVIQYADHDRHDHHIEQSVPDYLKQIGNKGPHR